MGGFRRLVGHAVGQVASRERDLAPRLQVGEFAPYACRLIGVQRFGGNIHRYVAAHIFKRIRRCHRRFGGCHGHFRQCRAAGECSCPYICHAIAESDFRQCRAVRERSFFDTCHAVRDGRCRQCLAAEERIAAYNCYAFRDGHRRKCRAGECTALNGSHACRDGIGGFRLAGRILHERGLVLAEQDAAVRTVGGVALRHSDCRKCGAIAECSCSDVRHAFGNAYLLELFASVECLISNGCHVVAEGHLLQLIATVKCTKFNVSHAVADGQLLNAIAIGERIIPNFGHAVGDGQLKNAGTESERVVTNGFHRIGDGQERNAGAIAERRLSDGGHVEILALVADGGGNIQYARRLGHIAGKLNGGRTRDTVVQVVNRK